MLSVPSRQRGVSLVELMISMVLGLMLMLAIFAGYAPIKSTVEQSKALEQANEVLRFATLTFTNSIKQADQLIAVTPDRLTLAFKVEGGSQVLSCLGNQKTADFTEQYRFTPPIHVIVALGKAIEEPLLVNTALSAPERRERALELAAEAASATDQWSLRA